MYTNDSFHKDDKKYARKASKMVTQSKKSRGYSRRNGMMVNMLFGVIVAGTSVLGTGDIRLGHNVFDGNTWVSRSARGKPMVSLRSRTDLCSYDDLGVRRPRVLGTR